MPEQAIFTHLCLIRKGDKVVVMDRLKQDWPGIAMPGGHIEAGESLHEAVVREVYEETGLTISNPRLVGMKHWHTKEGIRYLVFLYRTKDFTGEIQSTEEGEIKWVPRKDLVKLDLAYDMLNLLRVFEEEELSELFYAQRLGEDFIREFW